MSQTHSAVADTRTERLLRGRGVQRGFLLGGYARPQDFLASASHCEIVGSD